MSVFPWCVSFRRVGVCLQVTPMANRDVRRILANQLKDLGVEVKMPEVVRTGAQNNKPKAQAAEEGAEKASAAAAAAADAGAGES